jgi:hypothetical protein
MLNVCVHTLAISVAVVLVNKLDAGFLIKHRGAPHQAHFMSGRSWKVALGIHGVQLDGIRTAYSAYILHISGADCCA